MLLLQLALSSIIITFLTHNECDGLVNLKSELGILDEDRYFEIRNDNIMAVEFNEKVQTTNSYRVSVWSELATVDEPVRVVVQQTNRVSSWQIPFIIEKDNVTYHDFNSSRTLCFYDEEGAQLSNKSFTILLSTSSEEWVKVYVRITEVKDFNLKEMENVTTHLKPSQPVFYSYSYNRSKDTDMTFIRIDSPSDNICHVASIQYRLCPAEDQANDIKSGGKFQTILTKGGMLINKAEFPDGFFVVLQSNVDNQDCRPKEIGPINRQTFVTFSIEEREIRYADYKTKIYITVGINIVACSACLGMFFCFYIFRSYRNCTSRKDAYEADNPTNQTRPNLEEHLLNKLKANKRGNQNIETNSGNNDRNEREIEPVPNDLIYLDKLSTKLQNGKKSKNFVWHILNVFIFYAIPVTHLMISYQSDLNETGLYDKCYHNHLCSHPYGMFVDFNHIMSNCGYLCFGATFLAIVLFRSIYVVNQEGRGIPMHTGLFYAMGFALIFEGYLSANYHICPTQANFQFDTSFMFIMVCLIIVKLYQNRHPDINACAYTTFFVLGIHIFFAMIGLVFNHSKLVMIIFSVLNITLAFYISIKMYFFQKTVKWIIKGIRHEEHEIEEDSFTLSKNQFIFVCIVNLLNIALAITSTVLYPTTITDFGSYLLGILLLYAGIYLCYYEGCCSMHIETWIYLITAIILWVFAIINFNKKVANSKLTPAESREYNRLCVFMDYYDTHDVWHLLSAPALFFSFMTILTIDDNIFFKPRNQIPVF